MRSILRKIAKLYASYHLKERRGKSIRDVEYKTYFCDLSFYRFQRTFSALYPRLSIAYDSGAHQSSPCVQTKGSLRRQLRDLSRGYE